MIIKDLLSHIDFEEGGHSILTLSKTGLSFKHHGGVSDKIYIHSYGQEMLVVNYNDVTSPATASPVDLVDELLSEITRGFHAEKAGDASNCDNGVDTDLWDRANATDDQAIWVAPTEARVHNIVSTSGTDDSASTGAKTIRIWGLTSWSTKEVSEDISMDGLTPVATANSYVIINEMDVIQNGSSDINVGIITATAVTDGTVTAQINAGIGTTQSAIYGVPNVQNAEIGDYYASAIKSASSLSVKVSLLINPDPDEELVHFITKSPIGLATEGTNYVSHVYSPRMTVLGPCIIKLQANSSSNDTEVSGGFDLFLIDK